MEKGRRRRWNQGVASTAAQVLIPWTRRWVLPVLLLAFLCLIIKIGKEERYSRKFNELLRRGIYIQLGYKIDQVRFLTTEN